MSRPSHRAVHALGACNCVCGGVEGLACWTGVTGTAHMYADNVQRWRNHTVSVFEVGRYGHKD